jgi:predicted Zn-dependent protease with MMP-like domain
MYPIGERSLAHLRHHGHDMNYETLSESEWERVQGVWHLIDDGRLEAARIEVRGLLSRRPGHPDLRIVDAALLLEEGEPRRALEALKGAEPSADPAVFFHLRGLARYEMLDFEGAVADAEQAVSVRPDMPEAHDLLSRALEHLDRNDQAVEHADAAHSLDPERYPMPLEVGDEDFDRLVERSVRELPERVRQELGEIPVVVESLPRRELLEGDDPPLGPDILGMFAGRDLLARSGGDTPDVPGMIFLFRRNLLRSCADEQELAREIRITVQHEVGHLLGLDEDDLEHWGLA